MHRSSQYDIIGRCSPEMFPTSYCNRQLCLYKTMMIGRGAAGRHGVESRRNSVAIAMFGTLPVFTLLRFFSE